ncbi:hypothetical protein [Alkalicoccobacillus gibsonii]|uniref:hypothetical protein n=1 Tax=Alkalicoccobacillus gibsonii TaxID=79881 RepID=UPI001AED5368|nr:hypothetical protein [Alkalicoccobacillus gibsonii]
MNSILIPASNRQIFYEIGTIEISFAYELLKRLENQAIMYQDKQEETIKAIEERYKKYKRRS